ncbi:glycosyltransferase family 2 protein [Oxynema aestuarii]|uniref:Glycosyltransferase family 2 protein n=1 Tax=Oxynema aestuarii AP17 TaxID=2064643 RepID=A0A6H1U067_9CYAN|nr:glycosyltransferase family 2 protein [Oxynema aestuarii]QIZ71560.1 glycosyltransferase family 2 protein [Oxynema aestuarii AP17]RMH74475.1 MAG: glycosyltransferase family 2 protein [Cyanobacteria bacterium J007]
MKTPIVFLIFKRPEATEKVFDVIRSAKPEKLFVVADGARYDRANEAEQCEITRAIVDRVDWDCEVFKNYSDVNLGCAKRVSSGLSWTFKQVDRAIILEDDCIPDPSFFRFCEELLERYEDDERICSISGQNVQFGRRRTENSYYFSRYQHCWGWATWRRAWQHFQFDRAVWERVKAEQLLKDILIDDRAVRVWHKIFEVTYSGEVDSWASRWMLSCWLQNGLSILSNVNLISNIGFDTDSTNTDDTVSPYNNMTRESLDFPLKHPSFMVRDNQADDFTQKTLYNYYPTLTEKIHKRFKKIAFWSSNLF